MRINPYIILVLFTLFLGWKIGADATQRMKEVESRRSASIEKALRDAF